MSFSVLSDEALINSSTILDNIFITDFMPYADEVAIKVYIYGLFQCANRTGRDNDINDIAIALGVEQKQIVDSVKYWENAGVIRILNENPLRVEYLPLKLLPSKVRKHDPEKYRDFVSQLEKMILTRTLTPNELIKFVDTLEEYKISPDAMLMIAHYCINLKGSNIHSNYILTVAKAWANEGVKTAGQVEAKLKELEATTDDIRQIFFALGLKSSPDFEDKQYFIKWNTSWGYDLESILFVAKLCKKRGGIKKLDSLLDSFYRLGIFTLADIKSYSEYIESTRNLAININKTIGVYYENVDTIVEQYISPWLQKGFEAVGLKLVATYCLKHTIKTLEGMNDQIEKLYASGIVSPEAIANHYEQLKLTDERIKEILKNLGTSRMVTNSDRDYYNTWTNMWGMSDEIIDFAVSRASGKSGSISYLNYLIASFKEAGAKTVSECEKISQTPSKIGGNSQNSQHISDRHIYSKEEINKLFDMEDESKFDI